MNEKLVYHAPVVRHHGTIQELTLSTSASGSVPIDASETPYSDETTILS